MEASVLIIGTAGRHKNATYLSAIARSYAVVINGNFMWFLRKGDMTSSTSERVITSDPFKYSGYRSDGKYEFPIYTYKQRNAEDDFVPMTWAEGENGAPRALLISQTNQLTNQSRGQGGDACQMRLLQRFHSEYEFHKSLSGFQWQQKHNQDGVIAMEVHNI